MKTFNPKRLFLILFGNTLYTLAIVMFLFPNGFIMGGTTGLGILVEHYFNFDIPTFVMIFNVSMFILGMIVLGVKFALTTAVSTFYFPIILDILQGIPVLQNVTQDKMLATVCGGVMIGTGIGIVIRAGASTGGMDIPPLVLNKKLGLPVSVLMYVFDFSILILQMVFTDIEGCIYGILLVAIYTMILDKTLFIGTTRTEVKIVSDCAEEITKMIHEKVDRGVTLLHAETGYLRKNQKMVLTVVSNRELVKLKGLVETIDPNAFMIVGNVKEVRGLGFTRSKEYLK